MIMIIIIMIIIAIISIPWYLIDKGEHTMLYKNQSNIQNVHLNEKKKISHTTH